MFNNQPQGSLGGINYAQILTGAQQQAQNREFSIQQEDFPALGAPTAVSNAIGTRKNFGPNQSQQAPGAGHHPTPIHQKHQQQQQQQQDAQGMFVNARGQATGVGGLSSSNNLSAMLPPTSPMGTPKPMQTAPQPTHQHQPSSTSGAGSPVMTNAGAAPVSDRFGLLGLLGVIRMTDQDLNTLALGCDLTTLGLNLNSTEPLNGVFLSPWVEEPCDVQPPATAKPTDGKKPMWVPECYTKIPPLPPLHTRLAAMTDDTLFYIFYAGYDVETQTKTAVELFQRGWKYHKELQVWLTTLENLKQRNQPLHNIQQMPASQPAAGSTAESSKSGGRVEKGMFVFWDLTLWCRVQREFVLHFDALMDALPASFK